MTIRCALAVLFLLTFHGLSPTIYAQKGRPGLKGLVMDNAGLGVADIKVTVNGKYTIKTDLYGSFQFMGVSPYLEVKEVEVEKLGYKLKSWGVLRRGGSLEINVARTGTFAGKVEDSQGNPVPKVSVRLESPHRFGPAYTDAKGVFSMDLPPSVEVNAFSSFSIDGQKVDDDQVRIATDNSTVDITYNPPQTASVNQEISDNATTSAKTNVVEDSEGYMEQTVVLVDPKGKPMRNMSVQLDGKPVKTNSKGEITLPAEKTSGFRIVASGFVIEPTSGLNKNGNLEFVAKSNSLANTGPVVSGSQELLDTLAKRAAEDGTIEVVSEEFDEIFENLQKNRNTLASEADSLSQEFQKVGRKLRNNKELNDTERDDLIRYLFKIEEELTARNLALREEQKKTEETFRRMRVQIAEQDSLNSLTTTKLKLVKAEKRQVELEREKNRSIFLAVGAGLLLVAIVSFYFTRRMRRQKKEVERTNEELNNTKNQLEDTVAEVNALNQSVTHQNQKITSSIRYAQTIQDAVLPTAAMLNNYFKNHFIVYEPKDIVSGDFYWAGHIPEEEKYFMIAVDCTGHGVPGGFMSMIGHSLLNDIVYKNKIYSPAAILEELNKGIRHALKQEQKVNEDGMDVACCLLEPKGDGTTLMTFSGAMRPLYIGYRNQENLEIIKGDRKSAGGLHLRPNRRFTNKERELVEGDTIYLTSDGYGDQHNHEKEKVGTRGLIGLIEERKSMDMEDQGKSLKRFLYEYKEGMEQRDDIMVIGIRV